MDLFIFLEKSGDYLADNSIEKRPNYGFHLDMCCLALACANCNIRCLNCQNHDISQALPTEVSHLSNSYSTPKNTLIKARDIALDEVIKKVYLGNI